jgi:hypothetical protein
MALEGTLIDMSLVDLFQVFRMGPKTGVLQLERPDRQATLYVDQGQPIDAAIHRLPSQQVLASGETAVFELFDWDEASFCFRHDPSVSGRARQITRDSEDLVAESLRRQRQPEAAQQSPGVTLDTRLAITAPPPGSSGSVNLDLSQWRILSQIAITGNLHGVCDQNQLAPDRVLQIAADLLALGLIEIARDAAPTCTSKRKQVPSPPSHSLPASLNGGTGVSPKAASAAARPGKSLLNAVMRRVRGL